jgi:amidase
MTATAIAAAVRAGEVTAESVIERHLSAIHRIDPHVNAFVALCPDEALEQARSLDLRGDRGELPLAGVPVAVKDNVDVAGSPTRNGSLATSPAPAAADDELVARLRRAGAIVVGKTAVPELSWYAFTESRFSGVTRNPWRLDRTTGGSSGGSAAAVAAGMVPLATGSDALGSIRIPCSSCGVIGIKPGPGIVPAPRADWEWFGLSEHGPIATSVGDVATGLAVMAGRDDLTAVEPSGPLRIARSARTPLPGLTATPAVRGALGTLSEVLAAQGHVVVAEDPPYPLRFVWWMTKRWHATMAEHLRSLPRHLVEARTRRHARLGALLQRIDPIDPAEAEEFRGLMEDWFEAHDVLLVPAVGRSPGRAGARHSGAWLRTLGASLPYGAYALAWNLAGFPALTIPVTRTQAGAPVGVQLVGPRGSESSLLGLARRIETLRPWPRTATPGVAERTWSDGRGISGPRG